MRTARTIGIKADGTEVIIHPRSAPLTSHAKTINDIMTGGVPKEFVAIEYQMSDGKARLFRAGSVHVDAMKAAEKKAADKLATQVKARKDAEANAAKAKADAAKKQQESNAVTLKAKEAAKLEMARQGIITLAKQPTQTQVASK